MSASFFFQAEDGIRDTSVTGVQTCALPIWGLRLTANIAHEIRNPLSAIAHAGDLLQEEQRGPHKQRMVQIIRDNARRLERMVHDVLELSRRDRVQPETIRVRPYLLTFIEEVARNDSIPNEGCSS